MQEVNHPQLVWIVEWINQYPIMTSVLIFGVAMLESLVLVGVVVPGAALIISFGALVALGYLDFTSTMLLCIGGAVAGDGISFWIGYRYKQQLRSMWPFRHFQKQMYSAEMFFVRHGGKSIVLGRFVGPVRAVIPTIAGMMNMSPLRFTIINVISAIAWAPAYLLPGMVFGASLELASEVAIRLVAALFTVIIILLLMRWLLRHSLSYIQPRAESFSQRSLSWARRHRLLGPGIRALVDPRQPESLALLSYAFILIIAGLLFYLTLSKLTGHSQADLVVYDLVNSMRSPWLDQVMVGITMLADPFVIIMISILCLAWLAYNRNLPAVIHLSAALLFGAILIRILAFSLHIPGPDVSQFGNTSLFSFPSTHSTMAILLYGFLAIIISREMYESKRVHIYYTATILITLIAISQLYLGVHWLSDIIGGLALGLIWIMLLGIAYRRHDAISMSATSLISITGLSIVLSTGIHWQLNYDRELERYTQHSQTPVQLFNDWSHEWRYLPAFRHDLAESSVYPFNIQWQGKADDIRKTLLKHKWKDIIQFNSSNMMKWLSSKTSIDQRPVLPQVHNGHHESIALSYHDAKTDKLWIIRLWPANASIKQQPIWLGQLAPMQTRSFLNLFHYPVTTKEFTSPLQLLQTQLSTAYITKVVRKNISSENTNWDGTVLLVDTGGPQ